MTSCVRQKICFGRASALALPLLLKKEERAGERRHFLSVSPLSDSLPARSSRGERAKPCKRFACRTQLVCDPQRFRCLESVRIGRERLEHPDVAAAHRAALRWECQHAIPFKISKHQTPIRCPGLRRASRFLSLELGASLELGVWNLELLAWALSLSKIELRPTGNQVGVWGLALGVSPLGAKIFT